MLADAGGERWPVLFVNDACARGAGVDPGADAGRDFWEMFALAESAPSPSSAPAAAPSSSGPSTISSSSPASELVARIAAREAFHVELVRLPRKKSGGGGGGGNGGGGDSGGGDALPSPSSSSSLNAPARSAARFAAHFRPASSAHLDGAPAIGIPTVASSHPLGVGAEGARGSSADALYFITVRESFFFRFFILLFFARSFPFLASFSLLFALTFSLPLEACVHIVELSSAGKDLYAGLLSQ